MQVITTSRSHRMEASWTTSIIESCHKALRIRTMTAAEEDAVVPPDETAGDKQWTPLMVFQAIGIFVLSGCAEIFGGWLVWKAVRDGRPFWWMILGSIILVIYGFLPTAQPTDSFGRIYAVYGGFFIILSFLAGWYLDGDRPDIGDIVGGSIALIGALVVLFWPR